MRDGRAIEGAMRLRGISRGRIADLFGVSRCGVLRRFDALASAEYDHRAVGGNRRALGTECELATPRCKPPVERPEHYDSERLLPVTKYPVPRELADKRDLIIETVSAGGRGHAALRHFLGAMESWSRQRVRNGSEGSGGGTSCNLGIGRPASEARDRAIESRTAVAQRAPRFSLRLEELVQRSQSRQLRLRALTGAKVFQTIAEGWVPYRWGDPQPGALDVRRGEFLCAAHSGSPATLSCFDRQVSQRFRPSTSGERARRGNLPEIAGRMKLSDAAHHLPLPSRLHQSLRESPRENSRGREQVDPFETLSQAARIHHVLAIPSAAAISPAAPLPIQTVQPNRAFAGSPARLAHVAIRGLLSQAGHRLRFQSARLGLAASPCAYSPPDSSAPLPCFRATSANTSPDTPSADGERP